MSRLIWDKPGSRGFEVGVDRGVFYPATGPGVPWNGLLKVTEDEEEFATQHVYVDGAKYTTHVATGEFTAKISAMTYPAEFEPYDGYSGLASGQKRRLFNLSYRTRLGNDLDDISYGYKLHLVYNCLANPTQRENDTLGENTDPDAFEWDLSTVPISVSYHRPTAHFVIDSTIVPAGALSGIEDILYGTDVTIPVMPTLQQIFDVFEAHAIVTVTSLGNGRWAISGPDDMVTQLSDPTMWQLSWPNVLDIGNHEFRLSSY